MTIGQFGKESKINFMISSKRSKKLYLKKIFFVINTHYDKTLGYFG